MKTGFHPRIPSSTIRVNISDELEACFLQIYFIMDDTVKCFIYNAIAIEKSATVTKKELNSLLEA